MSDSLMQKPLGMIGVVAASVIGPYLFVNGTKSTSPLIDATSQISQQVSNRLDLPTGGLPTGGMSNGGLQNDSAFGPAGPRSERFNGAGLSPGNMVSASRPIFDPNQSSAIQKANLQTISNATLPTVVRSTNNSIFDFREVLRFDMTPAALMQRFPQITTVLAETQLDGMRVPFVSGTAPTDVAGTLSYYFDKQQSLRRIQMHGSMGDPTILVGLMTQYYHLQPQPSLGGYLYTTRWNNRVTSVMQIQRAAMLQSEDQYQRYQIFLELNQPSLEYAMTRDAAQLLESAQGSGRW